jgi:hypothetical protein
MMRKDDGTQKTSQDDQSARWLLLVATVFALILVAQSAFAELVAAPREAGRASVVSREAPAFRGPLSIAGTRHAVRLPLRVSAGRCRERGLRSALRCGHMHSVIAMPNQTVTKWRIHLVATRRRETVRFATR